MFTFFLLFFIDSSSIQATKDSEYLCSLYTNEIEFVKNCNNRDSIYALQDSLDRHAACALIRLKKYNKQEYRPILDYTSEEKGVSYLYPCPETPKELKKFSRKRQPQELSPIIYFDIKTGKLIE